MTKAAQRLLTSPGLYALIGLTGIIAIGLFLVRSMDVHSLGFPLDDAWIHQTYARNLAQRGEWAFTPGEISTGSTSPLWTLLLTVGYLLAVPSLSYSYILGYIVLLVIVWFIAKDLQNHEVGGSLLLLGLLIMVLFEWHLIWSALSGMETLLLGLHVLMVLRGVEQDWHPSLLGLLVGLGIWIRPDAVLTVIPLGWWLVIQQPYGRSSVVRAGQAMIGFAMLAAPYLLLNYVLGGEIWPSTYYAKQVEYAVTRQASLLTRVFRMGFAPLVGVGVLLLPGVVLSIVEAIRTKRWIRLSGVFWMLAFILVYAIRLPVVYQHGRYMIPLIPALFLLGLDGFLHFYRRVKASPRSRILKRTWLWSMLVVVLVFWVRGANAYANDVGIIETEMVAAARWIERETEPEALIAAHDIGALGYFSDRRIIDMAGLISPEVIPILRNEVALEAFLVEQDADYLMTFPGWYPQITRNRVILYSTAGSISPSLGGENMVIYSWP